MDEKARLIQKDLNSLGVEERIAATRQLSDFDVPPMALFISGLSDANWRVRKVAIETFLQLPHPENFTVDLIELLHQQDNAGLRNAAIEILIGIGPLAAVQLKRELACPDIEVRKFVIDILGEIGDPRCAADLICALADVDINVRYAAVETLGKLKVDLAVGPLLELMKDSDPGLKFTILQALAQIGGDIPLDLLLSHLDDRLLRKALFDCFGKIGGSTVVLPLVDGLIDPMRNVREAALSALYAIHDVERATILKAFAETDVEQIAEFLEQLLLGQNLGDREAALAFYGDIAAKRDLHVLLACVGEERLRNKALIAFSRLGEEAFLRLFNSIDNPDAQQTLHLLYVAGELGFQSALSLVIESAHSGDPQIRTAAARALGTLGSQGQIQPLLQLLDDEMTEIQDVAAVSLASLGKRYREEVMLRISPLLADQNAEKRVRAVRILSLLDGDDIEALLLKSFKDFSSSVRCESIRALKGHFSDVVYSGLTLALTDESDEVRRLAVSALAQGPLEKALPALKLVVGDPDLWVRSAVMRALELFPGEDVRDLLLLGIADSVGLVSIAALESAAIVLSEDSLPWLEHALVHPDAEVVKSAMDLLDRLQGPNWIWPFGSALLNHPHWDVRAQAAKALGQSKNATADSLLDDRLLLEDEGLVRQTIETAIATRLRVLSQG